VTTLFFLGPVTLSHHPSLSFVYIVITFHNVTSYRGSKHTHAQPNPAGTPANKRALLHKGLEILTLYGVVKNIDIMKRALLGENDPNSFAASLYMFTFS